ncbi:hypothetical protein K491DRAFT_410384 [Lophiostoma macrostomum CBS 122681]|uniref:Uncharacterized protein n=1 Tax=Lophiostoma macrostomum CBS 122681 TaxID=1314788 RepID=A0A6A6TA81_9PLEO|nr:hypothetical protein K491DRAFT_410384 [Lophiostoma macrostomum CBS 122681]
MVRAAAEVVGAIPHNEIVEIKGLVLHLFMSLSPFEIAGLQHSSFPHHEVLRSCSSSRHPDWSRGCAYARQARIRYPNFLPTSWLVKLDQDCVLLAADPSLWIATQPRSIMLPTVPEGKPKDYWTCTFYDDLSCNSNGPTKVIKSNDILHQIRVWDEGEENFTMNTAHCSHK